MKLAAIEHPRSRWEELGQFLAATPMADFMASMFEPPFAKHLRRTRDLLLPRLVSGHLNLKEN